MQVAEIIEVNKDGADNPVAVPVADVKENSIGFALSIPDKCTWYPPTEILGH